MSVHLRLVDGYRLEQPSPEARPRSPFWRRAFGAPIVEPSRPAVRLTFEGRAVELRAGERKVLKLIADLGVLALDDYEFRRFGFRSQLDALVDRGVLERVDVETDLEHFVSVRRRPDCGQLFFVFAGAGLNVFRSQDSFLRDAGLLERNLVVLRDTGQNDFVGGLSPKISDLAGLVAWMDGHRRGLGIPLDETYVIGNSMGAYAALIAGHHLAASEVWAFSPPGLRPQGATPPGQGGLELDIEAALASHNGRTTYNVYFYEHLDDDAATAAALASCPGVVLHPCTGEHPAGGHSVLPQIVAEGCGDLLPAYRPVGHGLHRREDSRAELVAFLGLLTGRSPESIATEPLELDSLATVQVIDFIETRLGARLPPAAPEVIERGTGEDLLSLLDGETMPAVAGTPGGPAPAPSPQPQTMQPDGGHMVTELEIGMPLTGRNNLAEGPLLKLAGDLQWRHTAELSGVPSAQIVDAEGHRLYATFYFVEARFPAPLGSAALKENDRVSIVSTLHRFGTSMLEGRHVLASPGTDVTALDEGRFPTLRLSNAFVHQWQGAGWLKKSRPAAPGFGAIPALDEPPDAYHMVKAAEADLRLFAPPPGYLSLLDEPISVQLPIEADRDLNGAGLLYFANYPVFLDIAERRVLRDHTGVGLDDGLLDRRSLLHRRSAYFSNATADDTLDVHVDAWLADPSSLAPADAEQDGSVRLLVSSVMYRRSDRRLMMVSSAHKTLSGVAIADTDLAHRLSERTSARI